MKLKKLVKPGTGYNKLTFRDTHSSRGGSRRGACNERRTEAGACAGDRSQSGSPVTLGRVDPAPGQDDAQSGAEGRHQRQDVLSPATHPGDLGPAVLYRYTARRTRAPPGALVPRYQRTVTPGFCRLFY